MAYTINGKVYSDHAMMDEIIYSTKIILNAIVLKNETAANNAETEDSITQADYYMSIKNGTMDINVFPLTAELLIGYGYTDLQASTYLSDRTQIPTSDIVSLLAYCEERFLENYVEYNDYYRMLNGLPNYSASYYALTDAQKLQILTDSDKYTLHTDSDGNGLFGVDIYGNIYLSSKNPALVSDDDNTDFNYSSPVSTYNIYAISALDSLGILDDMISYYTDGAYKYLSYLGSKSIAIYDARKAAIWDILYMPSVEYLVSSRFKELYAVNRDIYYRRTYQDAYLFGSDYYDAMLMVMILCQTFTDMIVDIPEWYIRRDVFDLRTIQYFMESQGVEFYKVIPIKYQIKIVKGLNKLIRYKSTTKNINDILDLFAIDGTTIYKYYLFKKYSYTLEATTTTTVTPDKWTMYTESPYDYGDEDDDIITADTEVDYLCEDTDTFDAALECHIYNYTDESKPAETVVVVGTNWVMSDTAPYDYYDEEESEGIADTTGAEIDDFLCEDTDTFNPNIETYIYDFVSESADESDDPAVTNAKEENTESTTVVTDDQNNVYELEFLRVPINESYDAYIRDTINLASYDTVTYQDDYWDGEDTHSYVKNLHLAQDFTIAGTKYMLLDYEVSMSDYLFQSEYFLGMIFNSKTDMSDVSIPLSTIKANTSFNIVDIFILLHCLSNSYLGVDSTIKTLQDTRTGTKPTFSEYTIYDGGYSWSGDEPDPDPDPTQTDWGMEDEYDMGDEETDTIDTSNVSEEYYLDFGYNYDVDTSLELHDYDFGNEVATSTSMPYILSGESISKEFDNVEPIMSEPVIIHDDISMGSNYWDDYDKGQYTIDIDGGTSSLPTEYNKTIDSGEGYYSIVTEETYYDWMRWKYPQFWVPMSTRIYGFNLGVNMTTFTSNATARHSHFGFERGFTLEELGVDQFVATDTISSVDELLSIYATNKTCYDNLVTLMEDPNSRDDAAMYRYVFNTLFTKPFDYNLYRLKSGEIASTYDQILRERDYTLYQYYYNLSSETNTDLKKDNIRAALNDITGTLEYYIKGNNLQYVFEFVPTYSFASLTSYIQLIVDFFKSWKTHFLNSTTTYIVDDKKDNKVGVGDQMMETKISYWYSAGSNLKDSVSIKPTLYMKEDNASMDREVIDMYSYYSASPVELSYDGGSPSSEYDEDEEDIMSYPTENIDGGEISGVVLPNFNTDGGNVAAGINVFDLDGSGVITHKDYLDIDGLNCTDEKTAYPISLDFTISACDVDGGTPTLRYYSTKSAATSFSEDQIVSVDFNISAYPTNSITVEDDGLYLENDGVDSEVFETAVSALHQTRIDDLKAFTDYQKTLFIYSNPGTIQLMIDDFLSNYFIISNEVIDDITNSTTENSCINEINSSVAELISWYEDLDPYKWQYF